MQIWFDHGLGDCVHFAHLLQLYLHRGYGIRVHFEENKSLIWRAAGVEYSDLEGSPHHNWIYREGFNQPNLQEEWSGNKIAGNINLPPLPYLVEIPTAWKELCAVDLEGSVEDHLSEEVREAARRFLRDLPRPIVLLHTSGTNLPNAKNIPSNIVPHLYRKLLEAFGGSLVLLDWDLRVPTLAHGRVRHIKRDWGHLSLDQLAAVMSECSLLIGVDSGPFHFASMTRLPALGIFHQHYPSCVTLPRPLNVHMARGLRELNASRRRNWNIVEYSRDLPSPEEIVTHALRMLAGPRYGLTLGRDVMMQQWVRDWCLGATPTSPLADRNRTFDALLRAAGSFPNPNVVETGCIRSPEDWAGAGNSTYIFGAWLGGRKSGRLVSIDKDANHCAFARKATQLWSDRISVECSDSVIWLRQTQRPIDILYLDSLDVEAPHHAEHGLAEIKAAETKLSEHAIVLYDDTLWDGGWVGKGALGVPYLLGRGWKVMAAGYQTVLSRNDRQVSQ
jgi:hypothetical protein